MTTSDGTPVAGAVASQAGFEATARRRAEAFLHPRGLDLDGLTAGVRRLDPDECLLIAGSVAEGLANADSDIDLMLIGRAAEVPGILLHKDIEQAVTFRDAAHNEISIETYAPARLEAVADKMARLCSALHNPDQLNSIELINNRGGEMKLLHRLRTGATLVGESAAESWRERLRTDELPMVRAASCLFEHFTVREDALSHVIEGDMESASWVVARAGSSMGFAVLAAVGETHYSERWLPRLLRRHQKDIGTELVNDLIGLLVRPPRTPDDVQRSIVAMDAGLGLVMERVPELLAGLERLSAEYTPRTHLS